MTCYALLLRLLLTLINLLLQISTKYSLGFVCIWFKTPGIKKTCHDQKTTQTNNKQTKNQQNKEKNKTTFSNHLAVRIFSLENGHLSDGNVPSICPHKYFSICCKLKVPAADVVQRTGAPQPSGFLQLMDFVKIFLILQCATSLKQPTKPPKDMEDAQHLSVRDLIASMSPLWTTSVH